MRMQPSSERGSLGSMKVNTIRDLEVYAHSLRLRQPEIPKLTLSWGNPAIPLPSQTPESCVLEPLTELDK